MIDCHLCGGRAFVRKNASTYSWRDFTYQYATCGVCRSLTATPMPGTDSKSVRFEYNAGSKPKVVVLTGTYRDPKGKSYSGTVEIPPYRSLILLVQ